MDEEHVRAEAQRLAARILGRSARSQTQLQPPATGPHSSPPARPRHRRRPVSGAVSPLRASASPGGRSAQPAQRGRSASPAREVVLELEPHHWRVLQLLHPRLRKLCRESLCDHSGEQRVIGFLAQHELLGSTADGTAEASPNHHRRRTRNARSIVAKRLLAAPPRSPALLGVALMRAVDGSAQRDATGALQGGLEAAWPVAALNVGAEAWGCLRDCRAAVESRGRGAVLQVLKGNRGELVRVYRHACTDEAPAAGGGRPLSPAQLRRADGRLAERRRATLTPGTALKLMAACRVVGGVLSVESVTRALELVLIFWPDKLAESTTTEGAAAGLHSSSPVQLVEFERALLLCACLGYGQALKLETSKLLRQGKTAATARPTESSKTAGLGPQEVALCYYSLLHAVESSSFGKRLRLNFRGPGDSHAASAPGVSGADEWRQSGGSGLRMLDDVVTEIEWAAMHSATTELTLKKERLLQVAAGSSHSGSAGDSARRQVERGKVLLEARQTQKQLWAAQPQPQPQPEPEPEPQPEPEPEPELRQMMEEGSDGFASAEEHELESSVLALEPHESDGGSSTVEEESQHPDLGRELARSPGEGGSGSGGGNSPIDLATVKRLSIALQEEAARIEYQTSPEGHAQHALELEEDEEHEREFYRRRRSEHQRRLDAMAAKLQRAKRGEEIVLQCQSTRLERMRKRAFVRWSRWTASRRAAAQEQWWRSTEPGARGAVLGTMPAERLRIVLLKLQLAGTKRAQRGGGPAVSSSHARQAGRSHRKRDDDAWSRGLQMACASVSRTQVTAGAEQGMTLDEFNVLVRRVARVAPNICTDDEIAIIFELAQRGQQRQSARSARSAGSSAADPAPWARGGRRQRQSMLTKERQQRDSSAGHVTGQELAQLLLDLLGADDDDGGAADTEDPMRSGSTRMRSRALSPVTRREDTSDNSNGPYSPSLGVSSPSSVRDAADASAGGTKATAGLRQNESRIRVGAAEASTNGGGRQHMHAGGGLSPPKLPQGLAWGPEPAAALASSSSSRRPDAHVNVHAAAADRHISQSRGGSSSRQQLSELQLQLREMETTMDQIDLPHDLSPPPSRSTSGSGSPRQLSPRGGGQLVLELQPEPEPMAAVEAAASWLPHDITPPSARADPTLTKAAEQEQEQAAVAGEDQEQQDDEEEELDRVLEESALWLLRSN
jgi:hypothetical protein